MPSTPRCGGEILVEVSQYIDDLWEEEALIYDALWSVQHDDERELPPEWQGRLQMSDEQTEYIRSLACDIGIDDHAEASAYLPGNASYEEVMEAVERLEGETDEVTTEYYKTLQGIVVDSMMLFSPPDQENSSTTDEDDMV